MLTRLDRRRRLAGVLVATAVLTVAPSGAASANAGGPASCMGHEASNISPPGSSAEIPGGMPAFNTFVREEVPGPPGGFVSGFARVHAGSHEACDA